MDNLLTISFEAHHAELNHHRRYQIMIGRDLIDAWTVCICYGRTGQAGREIRYGGSKPAELQAIVRQCLRRRLSATRRIGCSYRVTTLHIASSLDSTEWLPGEVMMNFPSS